MHPFEVFYDVESSKYYLFLPDGSVMVDGVNCECEKRGSDLNVELDISADSLPEKLYGHVTAKFTKEDDGTIKIGECKVSFDGESEISSSDPDKIRVFNFAVTSFGAAENDGNQYDILTSAINFSLGDGIGKIEKCECVPQKPDQISLNRMNKADGAAETGSTWQIMGFCKVKDDTGKETGTYVGDEDETIDPYGEQKNFAVISRQEEGCDGERKDEGEEEDKNYRVAYKKLGVKLPAPFNYKRLVGSGCDEDTILLENPYLFIDGKEYEADFDESLIGEGEQTLWLTCTRASKNDEWSCQVALAPADKPEGGDVINVKLYDLDNKKVKIDYRAAFINLSSPPKARKKPTASLAEEQPKEGEPPSVDIVEVKDEKTGEFDHYDFVFGIPPGAKGDEGKGVKSVKARADKEVRGKWYVDFFDNEDGSGTALGSFGMPYIDYTTKEGGCEAEWYINGVSTGFKAGGKDGKSIKRVGLVSTEGKARTYAIYKEANGGGEACIGEFTITDGNDGCDGVSPTVTIRNGYWVINGSQTGIRAQAIDGKTPEIVGGYWYIGGQSTGVKAQGTPGDPGHSPVITLETPEGCDGYYWFIDGNPTGVKATGDKGDKGDSGRSIESIDGTGRDGRGNTIVVLKDAKNVEIGRFTVSKGDKGDASTVPGPPGCDGHTPYIDKVAGCDVDYWFINGTSTNVRATGPKGDPGPMPSGFGEKSFKFNDEELARVIATKEISFKQKSLASGEGIKLDLIENGNVIQISATAKGAPNKTIDYVINNRYNKTEKRFEKLMAHTNLSTGETSYGSNNSAEIAEANWEVWWNDDGSAYTVPLT